MKASLVFYSFLSVAVHRQTNTSGLGAELRPVLSNTPVWCSWRCGGLALGYLGSDFSRTTGRESVDLLGCPRAQQSARYRARPSGWGGSGGGSRTTGDMIGSIAELCSIVLFVSVPIAVDASDGPPPINSLLQLAPLRPLTTPSNDMVFPNPSCSIVTVSGGARTTLYAPLPLAINFLLGSHVLSILVASNCNLSCLE